MNTESPPRDSLSVTFFPLLSLKVLGSYFFSVRFTRIFAREVFSLVAKASFVAALLSDQLLQPEAWSGFF